MIKFQIAIFAAFFTSAIVLNIAYAQTCGNHVCESYENHYVCKADCASGGKDNYCDMVQEGRCDPDCPHDDMDCARYYEVKLPLESDSPKVIFVVAAIISGGIAVVFIIFSLKRIAQAKIDHDKNIYNTENINKFTNIHEQKDENSWADKSETDIVNMIKKDDKYKDYFK